MLYALYKCMLHMNCYMPVIFLNHNGYNVILYVIRYRRENENYSFLQEMFIFSVINDKDFQDIK